MVLVGPSRRLPQSISLRSGLPPSERLPHDFFFATRDVRILFADLGTSRRPAPAPVPPVQLVLYERGITG